VVGGREDPRQNQGCFSGEKPVNKLVRGKTRDVEGLEGGSVPRTSEKKVGVFNKIRGGEKRAFSPKMGG